jgi:hypothetical protein
VVFHSQLEVELAPPIVDLNRGEDPVFMKLQALRRLPWVTLRSNGLDRDGGGFQAKAGGYGSSHRYCANAFGRSCSCLDKSVGMVRKSQVNSMKGRSRIN